MSARPKWIALDTMNYWIDGSRAELEKVLREIDILLVNDAEARSLARETNVLKAANTITSMGPKILVIKRGEYGALLIAPGIRIPFPAIPTENVIDPTGAGDTFAGGFLGFLAGQGNLDEATLRQAMLMGTVMASFTIENFGTEKIASVQKQDIQERTASFSRILGYTGT
jgi:sugar/nucleoside kinase (ribokinase family)